MFNLKKSFLLILTLALVMLIPMSFATDIDSNSTIQSSDVELENHTLAFDDSDLLSDDYGYDYESVPNETEISYELGSDYIISLNVSYSSNFTYQEYVYAYLDGSNEPISIQSPSGYEVYAPNKNPIININSFSSYLHVGENTVVFHPTQGVLSSHQLVNNNYVPIKIIASEPNAPPSLYYVDSSFNSDGNGINGSTYTTISVAVSAANSKFGAEGGKIIVKKGKNGVYIEDSTINIEKNIEITSSDDVTITSTSGLSLFSQTTKADVTLSGLTFKDIEMHSSNSAIYYQNGNSVDGSTLIIQNCSFINNTVPTLVRLIKTKATFIYDNFISNTLTDTGYGRGGIITYYDTGTSQYVLDKYVFEVSYSNIVANTLAQNYLFTSPSYQTLVANNNYWGSNYESKPTNIYNKQSMDGYLVLDKWAVLNTKIDNEIVSGNKYSIDLCFELNDGSVLADKIADLDISLDAKGIITPSNLTISQNNTKSNYIAPKFNKDTIVIKSGYTILSTVNISNIILDYSYVATPGEDSVDYLIGENKNISVIIVSDAEFSSSDKFYAYIGETAIEIDTLATNEGSVIIDLKSVSDKFDFSVGEEYTLYFHHSISTLNSYGINDDEYLFNPLTVNITGEYNSDPIVVYSSTPDVNGKTTLDYEDNLIITVNVEYNETSLSQNDLNNLVSDVILMFINGDEYVTGVNSSSKYFTIKLYDYKDKLIEGENNITFHPPVNLLNSVFGDSDIFEFNSLTVNFVPQEPPYVSTPSPSIVSYTKDESCIVTVTVTGESVSDFSGGSMYMYIEGKANGIEINGISSDSTNFTINLKDYDSYFDSGKTYSIVFHPGNGMFGYGSLPELDECEFNPLTVTVKNAPKPEYVSSPNETAVNYVFGESKLIKVTVDSSLLPSLNQCYVYAWINGDGANNRYLINGVKGSADSFVVDLADLSSRLQEGENTITFNVDPEFIEDLIWSTNYKFIPLTVYVSSSSVEVKYSSNATVNGNASVQYVINEHENVVISVECDLMDKFESYDKLYAWIGDNYKEINVMANEASASVDLKVLSDKFGFEEGETYTIYFHPDIQTLNGIGIKDSEYEFLPLTVEIIGTYTPEPTVVYTSTPKVGDESKINYVIGNDTFITVNITYNESYKENDGFKDKTMRIFINDDSIGTVISGIRANATGFTINLADYITQEGTYNISFSPGSSVLSWVFYGIDGSYEINKLMVNAVKAPEPAKPTYNVTADSSVEYTNDTEQKITVSIKYDDVYADADLPVYVFIGDVAEGILVDGVKANDSSFEFDLASISDKLVVGKNTISFHPIVDDLTAIADGEFNFTTITVIVNEAAEQGDSYVSTPVPNVTDYTLEDSLNITVNVVYDDYFSEDMSYYTMFVYINGEEIENRVAIEGINADATSFVFDLASISDKLVVGENTLTFHPHPDAIPFAGPYAFNTLTVTAYTGESEPKTIDVKTPKDIKAGEDGNITVTIADATGEVIVIVDGKTNTLPLDENGMAILPLDNLSAGEHYVVVIYQGDASVNSSYKVDNFTVDDVVGPEPDNNVTVIVDGEEYSGEIIDGKVIIDTNRTVPVVPKTVVVDGVEYPVEYVNGTAVVDTNRTVPVVPETVVVDGVEYPVEFVNGTAVVNTNKTEPAKEQSDAIVTIPEDIKSGDSVSVDVGIANATGNVSVIVDGVESVVPLVNGSASVPIDNISAGDHSVVVIYSGDETHAPTHSASSFTVPAEEIIQPVATEFVDIIVFNDSNVSAVLVDKTGNPIANAIISYAVGSESGSVVTDSNGIFTVKGESGLALTISYAGDDNYLATNTTIKFDNAPTVRQSTIIVGNNFTQYALEYDSGERGQNFTVQLTDANGNILVNKTVLIGYNGKTLTRVTNATGHASVQINLRDANRLTFAVTFLGDDEYDASMSVYLITINKKPVTITAAAKTYKATAKTKKYTVTLKTIKGSSADGKTYFAAGKKVTLKLNGKTYTAKTNAKGQATFSLKITKKGKYTASIKYAGDTTYKAVSKSVKITIK